MTSYTVTASCTNNTFGGGLLQVQVLNNAAIAGTPAVASSSTAYNASLTTTQAGSLVFGALNNEAAGTTFVAEPLCTIISQFTINGGGSQGGAFKTTSVTGTPGSTLVGSSTTFGGTYGMAAMEIVPASGGNVTVDASSPAVVDSATATTLTNPTAFTPGASSTVLCALVAFTGNFSSTTCVATVSDSSGLTWTEQVKVVVAESGTASYVGVWTAPLPAGTVSAGLASAAGTAPQPGIAGRVTSQGTPVNTHATSGSVTGTWPTGSAQVAGRLLVAVVTSAAATSTAALSTPSGWAKQLEEPNSATAHSRSVIYTKTAAGGDAAPTFTSTLSGTGGMDCMLFELIGADTTTITDTSGVFASGSSSATLANATFTATTSGTPHAGSFAIAVFNQERAAANLTFTDSGTGWTKILNGNGVSSVCQTAILVQENPSTGGTLNDHGQFSTDTTAFGTAIVYVFLLAAAGTTVNAGLATAAGTALQPALPLPVTVHPGLATAAGTALNPVLTPYITGLSGSTSAGYFTDQNGRPRWAWIDAVWPIVYRAGAVGGANTYQTDMTTYLSTRAGQGFNGIECNCLPNGEYATYTGKSEDGFYPFTGGASQDPTTGLNTSYWQRLDYLIATAAAYGITVFLNLLMGEDLASGVAGSWTSTQKTAYGNAVATRYLSSQNVVWMINDDGGVDDTTMANVLTGVRAAGDSRPIACENPTETTSRTVMKTGASATAFASSVEYNWVYSYNVAYLGVEDAYEETSPIPVIRGDGLYYGTLGNGLDDLVARNALWWSVASGSRGFSGGIFDGGWGGFASGWIADMTIADGESGTSGDYQNDVFPAVTTFLAALTGWQKLAPDTSSSFITAGRGTRATAFTEGQGSGTAYTGATPDTYVAGSLASDGSIALIYFSPGVTTTITVNQSLLASGYTGLWVDPASCATTSATTGSTYTKPAGANSAGDHDWVLLLQAPTAVTANAGLATGSGTALQPVPAVTPNAGLASGSGAALQPVATVAPSASLAAGTGAALAPVPVVTAQAGLATGTGSALAPPLTLSSTASAGLATATGHALAPVPVVAPAAGLATGAGGALQPGVTTGASAGLATAAGTALQPAPAVIAAAGLATATGTALQPTVQTSGSTTANAGLATAAGAALAPVPVATPAAGLAAAAGTAQQPAPAVTAPAALATGAGGALPPVPAVTVVAGLATAAGTALAPSASVTPATGLASASGTAGQPVPAVTAATGLAAGAGAAQQPAAAVTVNASLASGAGAALQPIINTSGSTTAPAGLAAGAGAAQQPVPVVTASAGLAAGTGAALNASIPGNTIAAAALAAAAGTALQPSPAVQVNAGLAAGTGTAQSPVPAIGASPALAVASGSAPQVITSVTVTAGLATAAGSAPQPVAVVQVTLGPAAAAGAAQRPGISITVIAGLATGTGTAPEPAAGAGTTTAHAGLATATGAAWQPLIPGMTGTVVWLATAAPPRWQAASALSRWLVTPAPPRWEATLMSFGPIAAISLEEVNVLWTADLAGTEIDPTGQTASQPQLGVEFAFPQSSGNPLAPAEPVTWYAGTWLTGTNIRGYVAQCLVGPGGVVTLTAGLAYDIWGQVQGAPENPKKYAGTISVF